MKSRQSGAIQTSTLITIVLAVLFVSSLVFGLAMLVGKSDLQKNIDKKVEAGVAEQSKEIEAKKDAEFAEKEKSPVKSYTSPSTFGTAMIEYPKTYSAYIDESAAGNAPINAYFHPNVVPKDDRNTTFALRMQVIQSPYDTQVKTYDATLKSGKVSVKPFRATKVNGVLGVRVDGEVATGKQGSVILLPLRDKTIKIWTENKDYVKDFDTYVVPSLSFIP